MKVYLDNSLQKFETIYPACGSSNSAMPLRIQELEQLLEQLYNYEKWLDVCKEG